MDIKVTKGLASVGNEELRDWTEKGWNQAMREGNYDRSREHLNFEIRQGGIVAPIDKSRPLTRRMALLKNAFIVTICFQTIISPYVASMPLHITRG